MPEQTVLYQDVEPPNMFVRKFPDIKDFNKSVVVCGLYFEPEDFTSKLQSGHQMLRRRLQFYAVPDKKFTPEERKSHFNEKLHQCANDIVDEYLKEQNMCIKNLASDEDEKKEEEPSPDYSPVVKKRKKIMLSPSQSPSPSPSSSPSSSPSPSPSPPPPEKMGSPMNSPPNAFTSISSTEMDVKPIAIPPGFLHTRALDQEDLEDKRRYERERKREYRITELIKKYPARNPVPPGSVPTDFKFVPANEFPEPELVTRRLFNSDFIGIKYWQGRMPVYEQKIKTRKFLLCKVCECDFEIKMFPKHVLLHTRPDSRTASAPASNDNPVAIPSFLCATCGKMFTKAKYVVAHEKQHEPSFPCELCEKVFRQQSHLQVHVESLHLGVKHECTLCGQSYATKCSLQRHIRELH
ncbi:hypothetical protein DMENIID0001_007640 [Sergentomyia squamirostris]